MTDKTKADPDVDILVVEDDVMLKRVMMVQLELAGFVVRSAATGQEALTMMEERLPSVLILDVGLPDMTGYDVVEHLRRHPLSASLALIVHTTLDLSSKQRTQLQLGNSRFITKTTAYSDGLGELVRELLATKEPCLGTPSGATTSPLADS